MAEKKNFNKYFKSWLRSTGTCFERDVLRDCKNKLWLAWQKRAIEYDKNNSPDKKEPECDECGANMKWWVTCYRCRNLRCRAEKPHGTK